MAGATAPLLGLEKKSLREQALSALRTAITSGELEPGRHLVETELSEMLQISRGTLREALRQLEQEGLLSAGPAAGSPCGTWMPRKSGTSTPSGRRWSRLAARDAVRAPGPRSTSSPRCRQPSTPWRRRQKAA